MRLKVDAEISFVAAPDGPSNTWPRFLEAQMTRYIGALLNLILEIVIVIVIPLITVLS